MNANGRPLSGMAGFILRTAAQRGTRRAMVLVVASAAALLLAAGERAPGAVRGPAGSSTLSLVGSLPLDPFPFFVNAYGDLAVVGNANFPDTGDVYLVDVSDPASPQLASTVDGLPGGGSTMSQAVRIGDRDVVVNNYQAPSPTGIQLVDITDVTHPQALSFFDTGSGGVHEMDLTVTPSGRTLALLGVPDRELLGPRIGGERIGDLLIVDISDPEHPVLAGEWGVIDEYGLVFFEAAQRGQNPRAFGHSVWAHPDGTRVLLAYKDAGVFILDITDPANPALVGRTTYPAGAEGEASFAVQRGNILIQGDEDYFSFGVFVTSDALAGRNAAVEARFPRNAIYDLAGHALTDDVVHVGRGCPAGSPVPGSPADPYLADPAGKIALIERGACRLDHKVARAQLAGAVAAIVYNADASSGLASAGDNFFGMGGSRNVVIGGVPVSISIPAAGVQRSTGLALRESTTPATVEAEFNGWGFLRFYDVSDPTNPVQVGTFLPEHLTVENVLASGIPLARADDTHNVHNPEVRGNQVYAPWRNEGLRIVDFTAPSSSTEVAAWTGEGAPAGATGAVWSVDLYRDVVLAVDPDFGLYVLRKVN